MTFNPGITISQRRFRKAHYEMVISKCRSRNHRGMHEFQTYLTGSP